MSGTRLSIRLALLTLMVAAGSPGVVRSQAAHSQVVRSHEVNFQMATYVDGLVNPWSIAWIPNGDMLVTERPGRLRLIQNGVLRPEPIEGVPTVHAQGQGGLLDVVPHPDFATNRLLYFSYSKPNADGSQSTTAVARAHFDGTKLSDLEEIFEAKAWSDRNGHYGSRLAFDAAGHLFVTVGDRQAPSEGDLEAHPAQDLSNHQGTMLRLNDDGTVPSDNPFVGVPGALPEIWSYGHRSPQGFAIDPSTGDLWQGEHGPQGGDELNLILREQNYGWPVIGYGVNYGPGIPIHNTQVRDGMERPRHFWVPSIATSGLMVYRGEAFPQWQGDIFVGGLAGQQLVRLEMEGQEVVGTETLIRGFRVRDVRQGPDGYIYVAAEDREGAPTRIVRLEPVME